MHYLLRKLPYQAAGSLIIHTANNIKPETDDSSQQYWKAEITLKVT
jgi:hypothetical protein